MEEFVPYILVLVSWYPGQPEQMEIERAELVYTSVESCETEGSKIAEYRQLYVDERGSPTVKFQCVRSASSGETDIAWQEWLKAQSAKNAEGKNEERK